MKNILLSCLLFFSFKAKAEEAFIIVFQAPLLKEPNLKSTVLQVKRKGERIYIPTYYAKETFLPEFLETYDRTGQLAYIPSKFIKLITNDDKEYLSSINYESNDPTDYRLTEPIPRNYPFLDHTFIKASFALTYGNSNKSPFNYNRNYSRQDYSPETGGRFTVTKKINYDSYDRYYLGLTMQAASMRNYFEFGTGVFHASEQRSSLKLGPIFTMDAVRTEKYRLSIGTGFTYNYHKSVINVNNYTTGYGEQRFFVGTSISPFVSSFIQLEKLIPYFDVVAGADIFMNFTKKLKADEIAQFPELWNSDEVNEPFKPQANLFLGVQVKY